MPLGPGVRYRVKQSAKGPVRLAFRGRTVIEAKNLKTGDTKTMMGSTQPVGRKRR